MAGRLEGKVAVVTGAGSGIGRACSLRFAGEGAAVVVADMHEQRGRETVQLVAAGGARAQFVRSDVTREADCEALADAALTAFGRLDVLVAAAGIAHAGYDTARGTEALEDRPRRFLLDMPLEDWEQVLAVNLTGVMLTDRAVARRMIAAGNGGSIINLASILAKVPAAGSGPYCVSKAGVAMLSKVLALEVARHHIRVNAIGPGYIETPMTNIIRQREEMLADMRRQTPLGRMGKPEEIAATAAFLASDDASYVTGEVFFVDGGWFTG